MFKIFKKNIDKDSLIILLQKKEDELSLMREKLRDACGQVSIYKTWQPPGHYYSPIPDISQIKLKESRVFDKNKEVLSIDMNDQEQLYFFEQFRKFYDDLIYEPSKIDGLRYYYESDNDQYPYSDAICLYSMIRYLKPKRIVEIGSGYSSAVTLDTNEKFFDNKISCTFIEPYPERLLKIMKDGDLKENILIQKNLQDVDIDTFSCLESGDILFIDSTHVSKIDSDVNYIFFEILPRLNKGVYIHFHDISYPFEYPEEWVYEGRAWNEMYLLRAFLQYNEKFKVVFFNTYFFRKHEDMIVKFMPGLLKLGGSIWLRKE